MDFGRICLSDIDWEDRCFEIRSFGHNARLHASLDRLGIIDPPWILRRGGKYIVVDGFKRLAWAREKGDRDAGCLLFPANVSPSEIWERRIERKLFEGDLNPAEKARTAAILLELYNGEEAPGAFLIALGIPNRKGLLEKWARLSRRPEILELLGSGEIADRAAVEVSGWEPESAMKVLGLLKLLRCSASIQVEIVERIDEISIRENRPRLDLLNDPKIQEIVSDKNKNSRVKTQVLRDLFSRMRFPRLVERERKFMRDVKSLALPRSIRIVPPPAFEGNGWKMELHFSGPAGLRDALAEAVGLAGKSLLDRIFDPDLEERS